MILFSHKFIKYFLVSICLFFIDQISKILIVNNPILNSGDQISIINPILVLKKIENRGIAFGIDGNGDFSYIFTPLTIILTIAIIIYLYRTVSKNSKLVNLSLSLILGGALGNLFDRIVSGKVVDFIDVHYLNWHWPTFNIADSFIFIGVVLFLYNELFLIKGKKNEI